MAPRPRLGQVARNHAEDATDQIHTKFPGRIVSFDATKNTATVDPLVRDAGGRLLGRLFSRPVQHPRWGPWAIVAPLKRGDDVWLVVAESSLDEYRQSRAAVTPRDPRRHALGDAVVEPKMVTEGYPLPAGVDPNALVLMGPNGLRVKLTDGGKFAVQRSGVELLDLIDQVWEQLEDATVATLMGPQHLDPLTLALLGIVRGQLDSLKA